MVLMPRQSTHMVLSKSKCGKAQNTKELLLESSEHYWGMDRDNTRR